MKHIRTLGLVLLLLSLTMPAAAQNDLPDLGGREIAVAVENDYYPFNFTDPATGEPMGWDYDAFRHICELLNCKPIFVEAPFEGLFNTMAAGAFDVSGNGITITDLRARIVVFSEPYMSHGQALIARNSEDRFVSVDAFIIAGDFHLGVVRDSSSEVLAAEIIGNDRVIRYETLELAITDLLANNIDAVLSDSTIAAPHFIQHPGSLRFVGEPLAQETLGFIFPPGSDLVDPFNAAITAMKENGYLAYLFNKWFVYHPSRIALPDLSGREIVIAVENAYRPFNFIDPATGEPVGWDYDAFRYICWLLDCKPAFGQAPFTGLLGAVAAGQYDASGNGIAITQERAQLVEYSQPYMRYQQVLLSRAGEDRFVDIDTFTANSDLKLGIANARLALDSVEQARHIRYDTLNAAVQALLNGEVDGVMTSGVAATTVTTQYPSQLQTVGDPFIASTLGFVFPKGSDLVEPFDIAISAMQADGTFDRLYARWFVE